ncbi:MAG: DUF2207 domain-containing protein, partial [Candidatus Nomurabacteria bacterium]|nr:DUF2207 domain-containing protein [Candidatus Nomurabacteria bacterium]
MKKALFLVCGAIMSVLLGGTPAGAVTDFYFDDFSADYYLSRDADGVSRLTVREKMTARFADEASDNHGIERAIPENYQFDDSGFLASRSLGLAIDNVSGGPYATRSDDGVLITRIGDADTVVSGRQVYAINWSASNVTRNFDSGDEFYWDANGDGWSQPFQAVTARVHIPADLAAALDGQAKCWAGSYGDTSQNCNIEKTDEPDGQLFTFTANRPLRARETLTFDIGFAAGTFAKPAFDISAVLGLSMESLLTVLVLVISLTVAALIWLIIVLVKFRPHKTNRAIIPQYQPPENLSVVESTVWWS